MSKIYDIGIIGAGMAGAFAALKLSEQKEQSVIIFDIGRKWGKRRRQIEGFLGAFPNSDGKFYQSDLLNVKQITNNTTVNSGNKFINSILSNVPNTNKYKIIKDPLPNIITQSNIQKYNFNIQQNDYIQFYPKDIHLISKYMAKVFNKSKNLTFSFDNEVYEINKLEDYFLVTTEKNEFKCKKILIAVGRSGWRWVNNLASKFGIIENNDIAKIGIKIEINEAYLNGFNKSTCSLIRDDLEVGPFNWNGTIIPEDHIDLVIAGFRSNEDRWKSDKVSFNLISNKSFPNEGVEQTERLAKLIFILSNDRIIKEKVSSIISKKSKLSIFKEFDWLKNSITEFSNIIPEILTKAYLHIPTIIPLPPKINLESNLSTEIKGLFIAGESTGKPGLLSAALTGCIAADGILK